MILFTDGEDHSAQMEAVLKEIKAKDIRLFVMGIGTPAGAPIPEGRGGFKMGPLGEKVTTKLEEDFLKNLALRSRGAYVRTVTGDEDLEELYLKGMRSALTPEDLKISIKRVWENRFYWPLGIALILLILERLIPEGGKVPREYSLN